MRKRHFYYVYFKIHCTILSTGITDELIIKDSVMPTHSDIALVVDTNLTLGPQPLLSLCQETGEGASLCYIRQWINKRYGLLRG